VKKCHNEGNYLCFSDRKDLDAQYGNVFDNIREELSQYDPSKSSFKLRIVFFGTRSTHILVQAAQF